MTLRQKQTQFAWMISELLRYIEGSDYEVTFAEAYRRKGVGNDWSLHRKRLAIDLNLFKNGRYLRKTKEYERIGKVWETMGGAWGGRFGDGNHFSLEHRGVK